MMSEAQLAANSSSDDDADHHESNDTLATTARKSRSDSGGEAQHQNENNGHAHYPTSTEIVTGNDTNGLALSTRESAQNDGDVQEMPEIQFASINNVNKTEANGARHEHTNTVSDDSLSRKNKVDNINQALSAPMSVLGANSDRSDFFRGGSTPSTNTHRNSNDQGTPTKHNALGKVKSWFAGGDIQDVSDNTALDYREFTSPAGNDKRPKESTTSSDEYIEGDVELASNTTNNHSIRKLQYNGEEENVMEKCSFAYGSDSPEKYKSPHTIPSIDHQYSNEAKHNDDNNGDIDDEEDQQYFGRNYQNRRINPKAMAYAIGSRAKRTWTERRYRRRLRQSQFIPPSNPASEIDDMNGHSSNSPTASAPPSSFHYELTSEHRYAFLAAHAALNGKLVNEHRNRRANGREDGFDNDLQFDIEQANSSEEEVRADLTKSSLAIRGGLIRLPVDNVRLVCDEHLQPGVLSIETRDMGGSSGGGTKGYEMFGNANRYGNIHGNMMQGIGDGSIDHRQKSERIAEVWERHELAYVLTVDQHIYQRVAQEMGDANRVPFGIYFCCHETGGAANHVGIEVAVLILLIIFFLLVAGMIAWPTW
eukprot:scaffold205_cov179-Skeletonema_menzelii.AAC.7